MNLDLLLEWMSQVGSGSWVSFKAAVDDLSPVEVDASEYRAARIVLSDLGFAEFFVAGTNTWRVLPPKLGGLGSGEEYHFIGARSAATLALLNASACERGIKTAAHHDPRRPARVELVCEGGQAESLAGYCGLEFCRSLAWDALLGFSPLCSLMEQAVVEAPRNWDVQSFDAHSRIWVPKLLPNAACEFASTHGQRKFCVHLRKGRFIPAGKREAVFVGAALRGVQLIVYDAGILWAPVAAPLPELLARAACCCTGIPGELAEDRILYRDVPPSIAAAILAAVGQRLPSAPMTEATRG